MFGRFRPRPAEDGLAIAILKLLEEQMGSALDITQRLEQRFEGRLDISAGEVYPILQYLEDRGFVTQEAVGPGKVYVVTEAGFTHLAQQANQPHADQAEDFIRQEGRGRGCGFRGRWHHHRHHHDHFALAGLLHDAKHFKHLFKHALRGGRLDPHRIERIRTILDRARREIEAVLHDRGPGLA
jgi:DNA-binding PadR family transcriptional regulator